MAPKVISQEELKKHSTEKDAWISIHGNVYDVTKFIEDHPGGPDIVLNHAGGDATDDFEDMNHSLPARDQLQTLIVGTLEHKGAEVKDPKEFYKAARNKNKAALELGKKITNEDFEVGSWKYYFGAAAVIPILFGVIWKFTH